MQQTGFAAACGADNGRGLAGFGDKINIVQGVLAGAGVGKVDMMECDFAVPVVLIEVSGDGFRHRVMDGRLGGQHFVNAVRGNAGTGQHHGNHRQHQEGHHDLHRVGDKGDHAAHLHGAGINLFAAEPDDQQGSAVHNQGHKGHHGGHYPVGEQLGAHQVGVGGVKACFLVLFAAECADGHNAGQNLAGYQVQPVHQLLHDPELGHGKLHQYRNQRQQQSDGQHNDPGQAGTRLRHMDDAANAKDGGIRHHAQQDYAGHLDLLYIVGGAGDKGCGGKLVRFRGRKADHPAEHTAAQIPRNGSRHAGSKQPHQNRGGNHQQGQPQHPAAGLHQVVHLYRIADAKGLIFQPHQQHCLG